MGISTDSYDYVLYVDEAGDDVLKNLFPENPAGASEWLVLAGYLVRRRVDVELPERLKSIRSAVGSIQSRTLHYRDLSTRKRLAVCDLVGKGPARAFAVCSFKRTMLGHRNDRAAAASPGNGKQFLYNFLVRMLLERATEYCASDVEYQGSSSSGIMKVIFSNKGGHHYGRLKAYLVQLRNQAIGNSTYLKARVIRPEVLRFELIEYVPGYLFAGLQMADVVASAFFQAVETNRETWSCEPAMSLAPIMAKEMIHKLQQPTFADFGVTLVPKPHKVVLDDRQKTIFQAYGYNFENPFSFR